MDDKGKTDPSFFKELQGISEAMKGTDMKQVVKNTINNNRHLSDKIGTTRKGLIKYPKKTKHFRGMDKHVNIVEFDISQCALAEACGEHPNEMFKYIEQYLEREVELAGDTDNAHNLEEWRLSIDAMLLLLPRINYE